jgi:hypothetical protein
MTAPGSTTAVGVKAAPDAWCQSNLEYWCRFESTAKAT